MPLCCARPTPDFLFPCAGLRLAVADYLQLSYMSPSTVQTELDNRWMLYLQACIDRLIVQCDPICVNSALFYHDIFNERRFCNTEVAELGHTFAGYDYVVENDSIYRTAVVESGYLRVVREWLRYGAVFYQYVFDVPSAVTFLYLELQYHALPVRIVALYPVVDEADVVERSTVVAIEGHGTVALYDVVVLEQYVARSFGFGFSPDLERRFSRQEHAITHRYLL